MDVVICHCRKSDLFAPVSPISASVQWPILDVLLSGQKTRQVYILGSIKNPLIFFKMIQF